MLLFLAFIYSLNYLDRQIVVILQEPIKADFQLADWELGLMTGGAFGLFYTAMGIPIAHVVDRGVNRVRLIALFTAAWSIMTAICGLTRNFGQFFVARLCPCRAFADLGPFSASRALCCSWHLCPWRAGRHHVRPGAWRSGRAAH